MAKQQKLPVVMTAQEKAKKSQEMAARVRELEEAEQRHKDQKREMKEHEDGLRIRIRKLAEEVAKGTEDRLVDVHEVPSLSERMMHTYRLDTDDLVSSRPMTPAELDDARQERLPGIEVQ